MFFFCVATRIKSQAGANAVLVSNQHAQMSGMSVYSDFPTN